MERDACNAKSGRLRVLFSRYRDACSHVAKRLNYEGVRLKASRDAAANKAEEEVSHFLCCLVFSMKDCVGKPIAHAWSSASKRSLMVVEILRSIQGELQDIVSGQSVLGDYLVNVGRAAPSYDVLSPPWIDSASKANLLMCRRLIKFKPRARLVLKRIRKLRLSVPLGVVRHPQCRFVSMLLRRHQTLCISLV